MFVVTGSSERCILELNVLRQLTNVGLGPFRSAEPPPSLPKLALTPNTPTYIPPRSTQVLTLTGTDSSLFLQVIVEPMESTDNNNGICVLRTTTTSNRGRMKVLVTNLTECDITIPPRAPFGEVSEVVTNPVTLHLAEAEEREPDFNFPMTFLARIKSCRMICLGDILMCLSGVTMTLVPATLSSTGSSFILMSRPIPPHHLQEVRSHIEDLVQRGIIETSTSPYAGSTVAVRKKSGGLRLCCDYRKLNTQTVRDTFSVPRIDECLDALAGCNVFSTLDLSSGFHQMSVAEEDRPKTAVTCCLDHFQWRRLPFGLTNAPATC